MKMFFEEYGKVILVVVITCVLLKVIHAVFTNNGSLFFRLIEDFLNTVM